MSDVPVTVWKSHVDLYRALDDWKNAGGTLERVLKALEELIADRIATHYDEEHQL